MRSIPFKPPDFLKRFSHLKALQTGVQPVEALAKKVGEISLRSKNNGIKTAPIV